MASALAGDDAGAMTENPTQSVPPPSTSFLDDSFARLRNSGYHRDTDGRWFGGVCTGLAQHFGVDPVLIRAAAVVLAFLGGIGLTAYVILWLLLPDRQGDILAERAVRQGDAGPIALLVLAAFLVLGGVFSIGNGNGWFAPLWLIPVAAIGWLVLSRRNPRSPQTGYGSVTAPPPYGTPSPAPYGATPPPAPLGATPPPPGEAMSAPTPSYAVPPMASAPTQTPAAPYTGSQPGAYRGPQPGTYGGPPVSGQPGPYGGRPTPPAPPRPGRPTPAAAPASPPAQCVRRPGVARHRARRDRPRCGAGRPARLPRQLGHPGLPHRPDRCVGRRAHPRAPGPGLRLQRLPRRDARPAARGRLGRLAGRRAGRCRRPHLDPAARHRDHGLRARRR